MTNVDGMRRAILADPGNEDDTPRLVYADALDEEGGEENAALARFIRLGCEAAGRLDWCDWLKMAETARPYVTRWFDVSGAESGPAWSFYYAKALPDAVPPRTRCVRFRRGFVYDVSCTWDDWLAGADRWTWHPANANAFERPPRYAHPIREVRLWGPCRLRLAPHTPGRGIIRPPNDLHLQPSVIVDLDLAPDGRVMWMAANWMKVYLTTVWPHITFLLD